MFPGFCVFMCVLSCLEIIFIRKRKLSALLMMISFLRVSLCVCVLVSLPRGAMSWSVSVVMMTTGSIKTSKHDLCLLVLIDTIVS